MGWLAGGWLPWVAVVLAGLTGTAAMDMEVLNKLEFVAMHTSITDGCSNYLHMGSVHDAVMQFENLAKRLNFTCHGSRFYEVNGLCNNLDYPFWGTAMQRYERELPSQYHDGKLVPRLYSTVGNKTRLPSARKVSTQCFRAGLQDNASNLHRDQTQYVFQFGQFIIHDLGLTPIEEGLNCCPMVGEDGLHPDTYTGGPCFPITIPQDDRYFEENCMDFNRSVYIKDSNGVAQQINAVTHFLDSSNVYGSTRTFLKSIRTYTNGTLRTDELGMLPQDNLHECLLRPPLKGCPVAGDNRLSVFPGLTATHVIFHKEHNRVARALQEVHPEWDDERVFQEARAILIAQTQRVIFKEFLPVILGKRVMKFFGLDKPARYDPTVNPNVKNSFLAAAFRFGHSLINNQFKFQPHNGTERELKNLFFRPHMLFDPVNGKPSYRYLMESMLSHRGQRFDDIVARGLLDFLFLDKDARGHSTDLVARNMQRGRDHGLPPFLDFLDRAMAHFGPDNDFVRSIELPRCAADLYESYNDIDLYVGGLTEQSVRGGVLGPTFAYLIGSQFKTTREGDRLFFDSKGSHAGFTKAQIRTIKQSRLARIICQNTGMGKIQKNVFKMPSDKRNRLRSCDSYRDVDFTKW